MDLKSVHQVFTNRILRIPSYQRGYSWTNSGQADGGDIKKLKGQLMDLWNDIINIPEGKWHYTGLLTLVEMDACEYAWLPNHKQYGIVDGQQRITSILILITVLIEQAKRIHHEFGVREGDTVFQYLYLEKSGVKAYIFGYDHDNPSDKYFRLHVLKLDGIEDDSKESIYTENLKNAKSFFESMVIGYLADKPDAGHALQWLFNRVTGDLRLNEYVLPKELDEYVVFETMNNRGKPLSELEKLKNRLMYLGDKFELHDSKSPEGLALNLALKNDLEESINKGWITIYQSLGASKKSPLDDEDFIKNHWIAFFDRYNRSEANAYAVHLFNDYFSIDRVYSDQLTPDLIREYVNSLQKSAVVWNQIHHTSFFSSDDRPLKNAIQGLHRVGFRSSFKPLVLAAILNPDRKEYLSVIGLLEVYAFKLFYISDRLSNTGDSKLYRLANHIYHSKLSVDEVKQQIEGYIVQYYSFSLFKNQIQALFETDSRNGFYGWDGIRYFLFEYDNALREKNRTTTSASALNWKDFNTKNTIEHIYPQSASKSLHEFCDGDLSDNRKAEYERLQANWFSFSAYSPDERKRLCNSLGNLLAISLSDNASLSNDPFKFKVDQSSKGESYKNRGYRYDSMSAQIVATEPDWTPEQIKQRGILMLDQILNMLGEPENLLSKNEKLTLLGLEFMHSSEIDKELVRD